MSILGNSWMRNTILMNLIFFIFGVDFGKIFPEKNVLRFLDLRACYIIQIKIVFFSFGMIKIFLISGLMNLCLIFNLIYICYDVLEEGCDQDELGRSEGGYKK